MRIVLVASALALGGCMSTVVAAGGAPNRYQHFAAGYLGCRARDVAITEHEADSSGSSSWVASCGEQTMVCGGWPGGSVHCAPLR